MGWRLVQRAPIRSALLAIAVALPVSVGVAAAGITATARTSTAEFTASVFGRADALVREAPTAGALRFEDPAEEDRRLRSLLPAGAQARFDLDLVVALQTGGRRVSPQSRVVDLTDPVNTPLYRVDGGSPSADPATLSLSSALADRLGVELGDRVEVGPDRTPVAVSALISNRQDLRQEFAVLPPAAVLRGGLLTGALSPSEVNGEGAGSSRWRVTLPGDDPAALEAALTDRGFEVQPRSLAPELAEPDPGVEAIALAFGLGLLAEVVLLISGAFAVVARTQRRQVALLAALGAPARVRRGVLVTYGFALGVTGALVGGAVGVLAAAGLVGPLARRAAADWGVFDPGVETAALLVACACAAAVSAAWWPARALASADTVELLRETTPLDPTPAARPRWRVAMLLGFAAIALGVSLASQNPLPALTGAFAGIAGTVVALLRAGSRLSTRDLSRLQATVRVPVRALLALPGRTAAVTLSLSVALALGTVVLVYVQTLADHQSRFYRYTTPRDATLLGAARPLEPVELQALTSAPGTGTVAAFSGAGVGPSPVMIGTPYANCVDIARQQGGGAVIDLTSCGDTGSETPLLGVAEASDLERLLGRPLSVAERQAYRAGHALTTTAASAPGTDGKIELTQWSGASAAEARLTPLTRIPALAIDQGPEYELLPVAFVSPTAATELNLDTSSQVHSYLLLPDAGRPPLAPERLLQTLPADIRPSTSINVETGPPLEGLLLLRLLLTITLGALLTSVITVGSAVALWAADLRGDYLMLGAVGASTGWRRRTGAWQGLLLAAMAVVMGGGWGLLGIGTALARANSPGSYPWAWLAALAVSVIACAAATGAALVPTGAHAARRAG